MHKADVLEVFLNVLLHIFLLSFFVITFYYLRALKLERNEFLSTTKDLPNNIAEGVINFLKLQSTDTQKLVCNKLLDKYEETRNSIQDALKKKVDDDEVDRKKHNWTLALIIVVLCFMILFCTIMLFASGVGSGKGWEILIWNLVTFVVFTFFELGFFKVVVSKFKSFDSQDETGAFIEGLGKTTETFCK